MPPDGAWGVPRFLLSFPLCGSCQYPPSGYKKMALFQQKSQGYFIIYCEINANVPVFVSRLNTMVIFNYANLFG